MSCLNVHTNISLNRQRKPPMVRRVCDGRGTHHDGCGPMKLSLGLLPNTCAVQELIKEPEQCKRWQTGLAPQGTDPRRGPHPKDGRRVGRGSHAVLRLRQRRRSCWPRTRLLCIVLHEGGSVTLRWLCLSSCAAIPCGVRGCGGQGAPRAAAGTESSLSVLSATELLRDSPD